MCGIIGEFGKTITPKSVFLELQKLSTKRGSDMKGYFCNENIQFGFNRLSIIDTTKNGNQPISSPSGRYQILCNGEIVNFNELIDYLRIKPNALRSKSDTEVVAHAIDNWGIEKTLEQIRGMFAMSIFDNHESKLYLVRDPAGIKPLYCAKTNEGWIFASQYDQIFKHSWFSKTKKVNINALSEYFQLGYIPAPNALYMNSWMIEPGFYYVIDMNFNLEKISYYSIDDNIQNFEENSNVTVDKLNESLISVFPDYIHSDVPIGTFLSGGIDSPLIASIISKKVPDLKAYTISSMHSDIDESNYAGKIANHLRLDHHIEPFSFLDVTRWLDNHFLAYSEPFSDFSSLPTYLICQQASKHYKVILSGDGGDELFWGYGRFLSTVAVMNWFRYPVLMRRIGAALIRRIKRYRFGSGIEAKTIGNWVFERHGPHYSNQVKELIPDFCFSESTTSLYDSPLPLDGPIKLLKWLRKNEFYGHMQRRLLKMDRASMAHGLEVRLPFLDTRIIDFSNQVTPSLGVEHEEPKILLKKCLDNYVPNEYILKKKQGFSINLTSLLRNELKEELKDTLIDSDFYLNDIINKNIVRNNVNRFLENKDQNPWQIWTYFALNKFAKLHGLS